MSREPTYPKDAAVDPGRASEAAERAASAKTVDPKRKYVKAGVAAGIGSAAIVAALLYANRSRKSDK